MPFDAILGQQLPIRQLQTALSSGHLAHAYLFSGIEGIGKWTTALSFAKALNCKEREDDFCDECRSCRKLEKQTHPDLFIIEPEKNVIKIESVRDLQRKIIYKPLEGKTKVVIIDQAEKLTLHAANCLLKTLEEPPEDTVIILVANTSMHLLPTIISRCQRIRFTPLHDEVLFSLLQAQDINPEKLQLIAALAQGSMKRALVILETDFLSTRRKLIELFAEQASGSVENLFYLVKVATEDSQKIPQMLDFLQMWYRDLYLLMHGFPQEALCNQDAVQELQEALHGETRDSIQNKMKKLHWIRSNAVININYTLALESMLLQPA
jgi:DNA polymerase-3 subunit delta'